MENVKSITNMLLTKTIAESAMRDKRIDSLYTELIEQNVDYKDLALDEIRYKTNPGHPWRKWLKETLKLERALKDQQRSSKTLYNDMDTASQ